MKFRGRPVKKDDGHANISGFFILRKKNQRGVYSEQQSHNSNILLNISQLLHLQSKPFWPRDKSSPIVLKPTLSNVISQPFNFNSSHTTVLRIPQLEALTVDVHGEVEDSVTTIVVTHFSPGIGTIRIENLCDNIPIRFHQK